MTAQRSATLNPRQRRAVDLLVSGRDQIDVAKTLGVDRVTIYRWSLKPEFVRAVAAAENDAHRAMLRVLGNVARGAAMYLGSVLLDDEAPVGTRVQAAAVLLARWGALQPAEIDMKSISMSTHVMEVDTSDVQESLRAMLDDIRQKRAGTEFLQPGRAIDVQSVAGGNGHSNGHSNGHANGKSNGHEEEGT